VEEEVVPVYVRKYEVTTQFRSSNPLSESAMETRDVLTMVVSSVDRKRAIHIPAVSMYSRQPLM
jgi:hypothetical protein